MAGNLRAELTAGHKWQRLLCIIVYAIMFQIAEVALGVMIAVQFIWTLVTGSPLEGLREFGYRLSRWLREAVDYSTWASDARPWPFGNPWPQPPSLPMRRTEAD